MKTFFFLNAHRGPLGRRWRDLTEEEGGRRRRMKDREALWGSCRSTQRSRRRVYSLCKCRLQVSQGAFVNSRFVLLTAILSVLCEWLRVRIWVWAHISSPYTLKRPASVRIAHWCHSQQCRLYSKQEICQKTWVKGFQKSISRELSCPLTTHLPAAAKHTCCIHPGWRKSLNRHHILHIPTHFSPAVPMHLASHVCCHYNPLSPLTEGWGTVTDLSSVPPNTTTDNFAFEGLNMHGRPKRLRARGSTIVWPYFQPRDTGIHTHSAALEEQMGGC